MKTTWNSSLWNDIRRLSDVIEARSSETSRLGEGDRRDVAILFLDLKDFTTLSEGMDPETLYDLVSSVMKTLSDVVEAYGGYVDKIQGDSIMALFGARLADENDSIRAVTCGMKMLDTIGEVNNILADVEVSIDARVGISYGTVTVAPDPSGHLTAIGDEVNLASRMEDTAFVNTIQVSSQVRKHCGDLFEWEDLGQREVRGRKKSVHAYRPVGPGSVQRARWERASRVARSPLVGREKEMEELRDIWKRQVSGELGQNRLGGSRQLAVMLCGEAGIGKSRLIHEFMIEVRAGGEPFTLLFGQTLSYAQQPFWLWITLIRNHFGIVMGEQNASIRLDIEISELAQASGHESLLDSKPFIAALLSIPVSDPAFAALDRETRHNETVMAIRNLIEAVASARRTVIILEDLHWIDSASREVLDFIVANCSTGDPMLIFCLYRPVWESGTSIASTIHENSAELHEMTLSAVPEKGCRKLIGHMLDSGYPDEVEDFLLCRSGGNPFFLEELVLDLIEAGTLEELDGTWQFTTPPEDVYIPSTLNSLIRSRIDRLQPEYRGGLQHCSVLGMDFLMKLYRRLHEKLLGSGEPEDIVSELTRRDFLRTVVDSQEIKFIFRHFLIHNSAYDTLLHRNRRLLHRYAAEAIEELFAEESEDLASVIAHHWERAGNRQQALKWGMKALLSCGRNFQNEEGLQWADKLTGWLEETVEEDETTGVLLDVLRAKQDILRLLGRPEEQGAVLDQIAALARKSGQDYHRALELMLTGSFKSHNGQIDDAQADLEKALELTAEEDRAPIYYHQGENYFRGSRYPEALECNRKVLSLTDDYILKARVELETAFTYSIMGQTDEVENHLSEAWKLIEANAGSGLSVLRARYFARYAGFVRNRGETDKSLEFYNRSLELFRKCGDLSGEAMVLNNMHDIYSQKGDYWKSLQVMLETARINTQTGVQLSLAIAWYNIACTHRLMKDNEKAKDYYDRYLDLSARISNELGEGYGNFGLGELWRSEGDPEKAEHYFRKAAEIFGRLGGRYMAASAHINLALMFAESGKTSDASEILSGMAGETFEGENESIRKYVTGLVSYALSDGDSTAATAAVDLIRESLAGGFLERIDVASRNARLAAILEELGRSGERDEALCRGSRLLGEMLETVAPEFLSDVIEYENLSDFMSFCDDAGCPVGLPSTD